MPNAIGLIISDSHKTVQRALQSRRVWVENSPCFDRKPVEFWLKSRGVLTEKSRHFDKKTDEFLMEQPLNNDRIMKEQVLLGMSGGTDSSVAAMLLQEAGYEVVGVTFRFYEAEGGEAHLDDARQLAARLGIRHCVRDVRDEFRRRIVRYFTDEYLAARTPVPCTLCNNLLKWPLLAQMADEMGIPYIATGHYVRKVCREGKFYLAPAADPDKDQSFFLWGLKQDILRRMFLPMGNLTKAEARAYAARRGFGRVAEKKDSLGVCFCPGDYRVFLRRELPASALPGRGRFLDEKGDFLGWHEGYPFYTVGQRRGLGIHLNRAVYVKEIRRERNEVVLAPLASLYRTEMLLKDWNLVDEARVTGSAEVIVKIRYRKQANRCRVSAADGGLLRVDLLEPLEAIVSGQAAAFYDAEGLLLGGGIIV